MAVEPIGGNAHALAFIIDGHKLKFIDAFTTEMNQVTDGDSVRTRLLG